MEIRPFLGSEALARGQLTRHGLRTRFRAEFPDVYVPRDARLTLMQRTLAAWLWSRRRAVVAGRAAAALHGVGWLDATIPVEVFHHNPAAPPGLIVRRENLPAGEVQTATTCCGPLQLTTPARTAFDIGRHHPLFPAVATIDGLLRATGLAVDDICALAGGHAGVRGLRALGSALQVVDAGAQSPRESWLRLVLIRAGLPRPQTQIPVVSRNGRRMYLDMGWPVFKVAVEYDGDHHRTDRDQWAYDIRRAEELKYRGWSVVRVIAGHRAEDIVFRVCQELKDRGYKL